jgi:hypothetical protein
VSHVIPKRKVPVRMRLAGAERIEGRAFLDYIDPIHRGEQAILDLLNSDSPWFPIETDAGVVVVNRARVLLVEPGEGVPPSLVRTESMPVFRRERISLRVGEGLELEGRIAMDLPDEFSRVSDFLNFPEEFFAVETPSGPVLVGKRHVTALTPHEEPPIRSAAETPLEERA